MSDPQPLDYEIPKPGRSADDGFSLAGAITWALVVVLVAGWIYANFVIR